MKRARTLTPLAVTALALLEERPMHPYEMLQLLRLRGKDAVLTIKPGSFYHTVARLAELGFADVHSTGRDGNRPERTLYALTEAGHEAIVRWVRAHLAAPATPQDFAIALAEAHNLDVDEALAILEARLASLRSEESQLRDFLDRAKAKGVPFAYHLEVDRRADLTHADVVWTAATLERLTADAAAWPDIHPDPSAVGIRNSWEHTP
ncbi:MAG TPA: PadR family transcriptional regulator [Microbacterium sp.]|uniref:PadR family transcriptional regulator n=1 Tax=Microbacterium sp. TaxID=51671 RepID=UPI002BC763B8|nr:PadR family transcriptional regulator [Microbacterium sp.]HWI31507.1 PadR family transcriptional regulator [Microbacterium sp.]